MDLRDYEYDGIAIKDRLDWVDYTARINKGYMQAKDLYFTVNKI